MWYRRSHDHSSSDSDETRGPGGSFLETVFWHRTDSVHLCCAQCGQLEGTFLILKERYTLVSRYENESLQWRRRHNIYSGIIVFVAIGMEIIVTNLNTMNGKLNH